MGVEGGAGLGNVLVGGGGLHGGARAPLGHVVRMGQCGRVLLLLRAQLAPARVVDLRLDLGNARLCVCASKCKCISYVHNKKVACAYTRVCNELELKHVSACCSTVFSVRVRMHICVRVRTRKADTDLAAGGSGPCLGQRGLGGLERRLQITCALRLGSSGPCGGLELRQTRVEVGALGGQRRQAHFQLLYLWRWRRC